MIAPIPFHRLRISLLACVLTVLAGCVSAPNRANKLIHLAILGITYIVVEMLFFVIKTTYRRHLKKSGEA